MTAKIMFGNALHGTVTNGTSIKTKRNPMIKFAIAILKFESIAFNPFQKSDNNSLHPITRSARSA
jgi:hypothetical protein